MTAPTHRREEPRGPDESAVRALCRQVWDSWNNRNSDAFAALFDEEGKVVGFDGSLMSGPVEIASQIGQVFANHQTASYVGKIKGVRFLSPDVAILQAIAGMVPPGKTELNPIVNAIHVFVAVRRDGQWRLASYQNTPAQFHGRPEMVEQMTEELRRSM